MAVEPRVTPQLDDEIDLAELAGRLWDQRKLILVITLGIFLLGCLYAGFATRIYQANSLLQVEPKKGVIPGVDQLSDMFSGSDTITQTEIQIVRSRLVLGNAVDQLLMDVSVRPHQNWLMRHLWPAQQGDEPVFFAGWQGEDEAIRLADFHLPAALKGQPLQLEVTGERSFTLQQDNQPLASGSVGSDLQTDSGIRLRVADLAAPVGTVFDLMQRPRYQVLTSLKQRLSISEQGQKTGILQLSLTDPMPARAVAILQAIDQSYLLQNIERSSAQASQSLEFVDKQLPEIKQKLNDAEDKLNIYRQKSDSVDVSLQTESLLKRLVGIETQINDLKLKESDLASLYTKDHPTYRSLLRQMESLQNDKAKLEKDINKLPETQQEVLRLTRDVQTNQQIYMQMLNNAQELKIAKASTVGNVRIIDAPVATPTPIEPKVPLVLALSLLLGLMVSVGYVFLRMALHRGLETPAQLEQLGLPVYATLPLSASQRDADERYRLLRRRKKSGSRFLLATQDPGDISIEALRSLRTSLHFAMLETNNRIMITGASPGAGKSFVSANLAAVLALSGKKVLLIDADMRRGHLHEIFGMTTSGTGLSGVLSGQATLADAVQVLDTDGLSLLPRGQIPPNPSELLMQPRLTQLLEEASKNYDLVLVDTPPILAVTDAAIVGQKIGATLLVARYRINTQKEIETAQVRFEKSNVVIKGCIFNCIERQANNYYYYDYAYKSEKA